MTDDRITLDRDALKALSSDTRVALLKALDARNKTPSELARETRLSVQSVSEHLARLESAGLVARVESQRKWVYHTLTDKGRAVVRPDKPNAGVWIVLGLSLLALGLVWMFQPPAQTLGATVSNFKEIQPAFGPTLQDLTAPDQPEARAWGDAAASGAASPLMAKGIPAQIETVDVLNSTVNGTPSRNGTG